MMGIHLQIGIICKISRISRGDCSNRLLVRKRFSFELERRMMINPTYKKTQIDSRLVVYVIISLISVIPQLVTTSLLKDGCILNF